MRVGLRVSVCPNHLLTTRQKLVTRCALRNTTLPCHAALAAGFVGTLCVVVSGAFVHLLGSGDLALLGHYLR